MTHRPSSIRRVAAAALVVLGVTSCSSWQGPNSLPLPGIQGRGSGSFTIQAQMSDIDNIDRNSRVRVGDVTVGTVTNIERQGWHALVTMSLDGGVSLPANATAKLGQTSLLGSKHIELAAPTALSPEGELHQGSVIPLSSSGAYPGTERTLAALSVVLNGGGIGQIQEITQVLSQAFAGREDDLRSLIVQFDQFVGNLDGQSDDIIAATESLNNLAGQISAEQPVVDSAIETIPDALAVLSDERDDLVTALDRFGRFSGLAADTVNQTKQNLISELKALGPVVQSLADSGPAFTKSLGLLATYPYPKDTLTNWLRGDYANLTAVIDLTLSRLDASFFTGTRFEGNLTELEMQWGRTIGQNPSPYTTGNPLVAPYHLDQGR